MSSFSVEESHQYDSVSFVTTFASALPPIGLHSLLQLMRMPLIVLHFVNPYESCYSLCNAPCYFHTPQNKGQSWMNDEVFFEKYFTLMEIIYPFPIFSIFFYFFFSLLFSPFCPPPISPPTI